MAPVDVEVIRPQPPQTGLAGAHDVVARQPRLVRPLAGGEAHLGGEQHALAAAFEHLADDLLRLALRVDVGGVHHVDAGLKAHVDEPPTSVAPTLANGPWPPNVIVPSVSVDTLRPERPSGR